MSSLRTTPDENTAPLEVVIIGAGVAGLAVTYGLTRPDIADRFKVRVLEKRTESQCCDAGYPIHVSPSGHEAIASLFSPADQTLLLAARQSLPTRHDGITFLNSAGKRIWHTIRDPLESCMIERGDLLRVMRDAVGKVGLSIEYGRRVVAVKDLSPISASARKEKMSSGQGGKAMVMLSDGETIECDLLIGADGMYSPARKTLHPNDNFAPLPYVTLNFRAGPSMASFIADNRGMNVMYGTGWSAALIPLPAEGVYIALTVPSPVIDIPSALAGLAPCPFIDTLRIDECVSGGRPFPLYSAKHTQVGRGRVVLVADAAHGMNIDEALIKFHKRMAKTSDPMIKLSKFLLWLAQGKTPMDRLIRGTAFRTIEVVEQILPTRRRMKAKLLKVLQACEERAVAHEEIRVEEIKKRSPSPDNISQPSLTITFPPDACSYRRESPEHTL